jgi:hypothetical protein
LAGKNLKHDHYRNLKVMAAALLAIGPGARPVYGQSVQTGNSPADTAQAARPYGAATLEATDQKLLTESLLAQVKAYGLKPPAKTNLFPRDKSWLPQKFHDLKRWFNDRALGHDPRLIKENPGVAQTGYDFRKDSITGFARDGDERYIMRRDLEMPPYSGSCHSIIDRDFDAYRVVEEVHEFTHYVVNRMGLSEKTLQKVLTNETLRGETRPDLNSFAEIDLMRDNIEERIADASAVLYIKSNYGSSAPLDQMPDWRQTEISAHTPDHFTSSSIAVALADFGRNPVRGMTIIEAVQRATDIVAAQPELWEELKHFDAAAREVVRGIKPAVGDKSSPAYDEKAYAEIRAQERVSFDARNRICANPLR